MLSLITVTLAKLLKGFKIDEKDPQFQAYLRAGTQKLLRALDGRELENVEGYVYISIRNLLAGWPDEKRRRERVRLEREIARIEAAIIVEEAHREALWCTELLRAVNQYVPSPQCVTWLSQKHVLETIIKTGIPPQRIALAWAVSEDLVNQRKHRALDAIADRVSPEALKYGFALAQQKKPKAA